MENSGQMKKTWAPFRRRPAPFQCRRTKCENQVPRERQTKKMRPGPATRAASYVVSCRCLIADWRNDCFSPTAPESSAALAKASCRFVTSRSRIYNHTVGPRPSPAPRSRMGEEAATPGQPVALARVLWIPPGNSPSRITGCRWPCRNRWTRSGTSTFR